MRRDIVEVDFYFPAGQPASLLELDTRKHKLWRLLSVDCAAPVGFLRSGSGEAIATVH